jgi:HEAT repeat protein
LPARQFGYGLALFAWLRNETCPRWAKYLKGDGREALRLGLRYITKTRDARFHPDWDGATRARSAAELVEELRARRAGTRYSALKELSALPELNGDAVSAVTRSLRDADTEVRALAAEVLGAQTPVPEAAIEDLRELLSDDEGLVRIAAAGALASVPDLPDGVLDDLLLLLDPERQKSAVAAVAVIQRFGHRAERITPRVLDCLARSLAQCNDANTAAFCDCLWAICEEPFATAERHFGESRLELLADVQAAIRKTVQAAQRPQILPLPDQGSGT